MTQRAERTISGDRHLRPEPGGKLKGLLDGSRTVRVRVDAPYAATFSGQVLLQLLVNLLCRQFGVIELVQLDILAVPADRRAFPLAVPPMDDLRLQLMALGAAVGGDEIRVEHVDHAAAGASSAGVTILVGPSLKPHDEMSPLTLVVYGDGWDAFCSSTQRSPHTAPTSQVPFGPLLAACLAAGKVFRHFHQTASRGTSDLNLWEFGAGVWRNGGGPELIGLCLPTAYLIGLGAVGAAFALSLALAAGVSGSLIGMDPQTTDETGRNQLLSALYHEVGLPKVALVKRLFDTTGIAFYANQARWPDYAADARRCAPEEARREEDAFRYEWVISCVDRNVHRQNIAAYLPRHVLSGSTDGLVAQAAYYAMEGECECLACNHPVPLFSLEGFVEVLRGLSPEQRSAYYEVHGINHAMRAAIDEYLFAPSCGHVAEAELRRLGVEGTTDWSVGFVSAAAGVMLASLVVRSAAEGVAEAIGPYSERRLIFLGAEEFSKSRARRKPECLLCADAVMRGRYARRWQTDIS